MSEREVCPQAGSSESIAGMIRQLTHEARNALQHSQAALERLRWRLADQPEALAQLALAQGAQEEMVRLCEAAHVCTAPLTLHRDWHDVGEIGWEAAARGVAQAGQVQVVDKLGAVSRRCEVDRTRLIQAFRYLLGYAAGTATGPIVLTVTAEDCRLADRP